MAEVNSDCRTKKKNVCDSIIFEVDLADCSPEHSPKNSTNEDYSQKSSDYSSQDTGIFSQETKTSSQEIELSESDLPQESNNTLESSSVITEQNGAACDETDCKLEVVESEISIAVESSDDVQTVEQVAESDNVCHLPQNIVSEDGQITVEKRASSITVTEKIENEQQKNIVEFVEVIETTTATKDDVVINEIQMNVDVSIESCETIDGMTPENLPEEGEVLEETNSANASSIISISFKDVAIAKEYKPHFIKFLRTHPELEVVETDEDCLTLNILRDADLPTGEWIVMDEALGETPKPRLRKRKRSERKKENEMFMLDTSPSITTKENASLKYASKFSVGVNKEEEGAVEVKTAGGTCFNCDGNHSLKDCTEPKNYAKINIARNSYKGGQVKSS